MEHNSPDVVLRHAGAAKRILDDPEFQAAVTTVEENYIEGWKSSKTAGERESAHARYTALRDVVKQLRLVFDRGETQKAHDTRNGRGT